MRESSARPILATLTDRRLFSIDALGAAVTAVMLGVVLPALEAYVGMTARVLVPLSFVALGFAVCSSACFTLHAGSRWLLVIAAANTAYCLSTLSLAGLLWSTLTGLGVVYFLG
jgi:hypothetical protein